jgi:uncharacterized membrane protein
MPYAPQRFAALDTLRGIAMVWMTAYHFCFDLQHYGYLEANFYVDSLWTVQRTAIVSLFVFCAGMSQAIAQQQGQNWAQFLRRWWQIVACAVLVSAGSYLMYPQTFIYFGILHGIALMLLLTRWISVWGRGLWVLGAIAFAMPFIAGYAHSIRADLYIFNEPALNWLGLISRKPITEDYAPVFPWLGCMLWGVAAGRWCLLHRRQWLQTTLPAVTGPLAALGRWSLSYYMLHQPVLLGAILAFRAQTQ